MPQFRPPARGDRILILKQPFLDLILSGVKTLEIRSRRLARQKFFLGCRGHIYGSATVSDAVVVTAQEWRAMIPLHRWDVAEPPYARTWAHTLTQVVRSAAPLPYRHPRGAIGIVLY